MRIFLKHAADIASPEAPKKEPPSRSFEKEMERAANVICEENLIEMSLNR